MLSGIDRPNQSLMRSASRALVAAVMSSFHVFCPPVGLAQGAHVYVE